MKRIAVIVVGLLCLVGVSGCSTNPNAAAIVNGKVITEASAKEAGQAWFELLQTQSEDQDTRTPDVVMLNFRIMGAVIGEALSSLNVTISDEDRDAMWESAYGAAANNGIPALAYPLRADPRSRDSVGGSVDFEIVDWMIQSGEIDYDELIQAIDDVDVTVNPRYGVWDPESWALSNFPVQGMPWVIEGPLAEQIDFEAGLG